jgi:hypothetical protein
VYIGFVLQNKITKNKTRKIMLQNSSEFNSVGPGFGGFGGGFGQGGLGLFGLLGLKGIGDLDGRDRRGDDDGCRNEIATLAAIASAKDTTVAEGRALGAAICNAEKTNMQQFYAQAIQEANNTQAIKDQATAFAIVNDKRFDDLASAGVLQTAAILAKINQTEIDNLRDQLAGERRRGDSRELEINITNSNTNIQNQLQAQAQVALQRDFDNSRRFDALFNQTAKAGQDIISVGSVLTGIAQTANPTNVNSKN